MHFVGMRILFICKCRYTNKDLLEDRFGRLYHLPVQLQKLGTHIQVDALDYRSFKTRSISIESVLFRTVPVSLSKIPFLPLVLFQSVKKFEPHIILASGDSHLGFLGLFIARKLNVPFVFDVYDYYPAFKGNRIPGLKSMFHASVRRADLVLCASGSLEQKLKPINRRTLLVENGVDTALFRPLDMNEARRALGLAADGLYVGYFGTIESSRGPLLLEAARLLREGRPELRLLLAGEVRGVDLSAPWITHYGNVPQEQVPRLINACDVVTIPYASSPFNDHCGACKIAEYLACDKPVVVTAVSDHRELFRNAEYGLCEPNSESLKEALLKQIHFPKRPEFPDRLSWLNVAKKLYSHLSKKLELKPDEVTVDIR
jgi:glycosyltransferase involved in cell wall biosynthesis